jgi:hypothetical protein
VARLITSAIANDSKIHFINRIVMKSL